MSEPMPKLPPLQRLCDVCQGDGQYKTCSTMSSPQYYVLCERCGGCGSVPTDAGKEILNLVGNNLKFTVKNVGGGE